MPRTILRLLYSPLTAVMLVACSAGDSTSAAEPQTPMAQKPATKPEEPMPKKTTEPVQATKPAMPATPAATSPADSAMTAIREFIESKKIDKTAKDWKTKVTKPPKLTFDATHKYYWLLNTTEGPIKVRLMPDVAPMHVSSTIYLTEIGFYDDTLFHRVIPGFMAQGGDPLGQGIGGPAYKYGGEFSPTVKHTKPGTLSMANAGPDTDGSQFFLTFVPTPHLDGKHTVFGEVVEGLDNLKKLEKFGSQQGKTSKPLKIETAKIIVE